MAKRKTKYADILAALQDKPGMWALIDSSPRMTNLANKLRVDYGMEVATRHISSPNTGFGVWAKWPTNESHIPNVAVRTAAEASQQAALVWQNPPERGRGGKQPLFDYDLITAKLRSKPGEWFFVGTVDSNGRVSAGISLRSKGRDCEVVTRKLYGTATYRIWARLPKNFKASTTDVVTPSTPDDQWGDPPLRSSHYTPPAFDYTGVTKELFDNKGKWGRIWVGNKKSSESISRWFNSKGFETATRTLTTDNLEEKEYGVWAMCPTKKQTKIKTVMEDLMSTASGSLSKQRTSVSWEDLPDARENVAGKYDKVVQQLKTKPGKWAFIGEYHRNEFTSVYHGVVRNGCQATTRVMKDSNMRGIWAMWPLENNK